MFSRMDYLHQPGGGPGGDGEPWRAAIYARLSQNRDGEKEGTARQVGDCRAFVAERGLLLAEEHVFIDEDRSASSGARRPAYEAMMAGLAERRFEVVVAWRLDRLLRKMVDAAHLFPAAKEVGGYVMTVQNGVDTSHPQGEMWAYMLAMMAQAETEAQSARQTRLSRDRRDAGRANPGGPRPFGLSADRQSLDPVEAQLIRQAARRVVAGWTIRSICRDWQMWGVRTTWQHPKTKEYGRWQPTPLREMLINPRLVGVRTYKGRAVGPATGAMPRILDDELFEQVCRILTSPERRTTPQGASSRRYLLSGLVYCGKPGCGQKLAGRPNERGVRRYVCATAPGRRGCNGTAITAAELEADVAEQVIYALDGPVREQARRADHDPAHQQALSTLDACEAQLAELDADYYGPANTTRAQMSPERYRAQVARLEAERAKAERVLSARSRNVALAALPEGGSLTELWDSASFAWRRTILENVVGRIVIGPAVRGRNRYDPDRVTITDWKV